MGPPPGAGLAPSTDSMPVLPTATPAAVAAIALSMAGRTIRYNTRAPVITGTDGPIQSSSFRESRNQTREPPAGTPLPASTYSERESGAALDQVPPCVEVHAAADVRMDLELSGGRERNHHVEHVERGAQVAGAGVVGNGRVGRAVREDGEHARRVGLHITDGGGRTHAHAASRYAIGLQRGVDGTIRGPGSHVRADNPPRVGEESQTRVVEPADPRSPNHVVGRTARKKGQLVPKRRVIDKSWGHGECERLH